MRKNPTLTAVDAVEQGIEGASPPSSRELRAQTAFVRTLADEIERHHPADRQIAALRGQLGDELERLSALVGQRSSAAPEPRGTGPVRVLVADDDLAGRVALATAVRSFGHECVTAEDADEALRIHASGAVDVVIADWHMPKMNGLDLCRALKGGAHPPYVILVTAHPDDVGEVARVEGRPDDFLAKPIDLDDLESRLQGAARLVHSIRGLDSVASMARSR
jgi:CheY-like chemotaxis protein